MWYTTALALLSAFLIIHFSGTELSEGSFWRLDTQGLKQAINHYGALLLKYCTDQITCRSSALPGGPVSVSGLKFTVFIWRARAEEESVNDTKRKRSNQGEWDIKKRTKMSRTIQSESMPTSQLLTGNRQGYLRLNACSRNSLLVLSAGWHFEALAG